MSFFLALIGKSGLIGLIGLALFLLCYKYSQGIFDWIENQTFGTRSYIMEKLELLFIEIPEQRITYALLGCSVGLGCFMFLFLGLFSQWVLGFILGLVFGFIGFKIPKPIINYLVERRINEYSGQMVDALTLLSNGIRAGLSVPQAIGMVVDEMPAPVSQEFNMILQQNRIGVPLEECFDNLAKRVPTEDNDMFVSSINILRETGGNLAEVFDTIVEVIRERVRLKQKIDTYTAQGMFQGMTIFLMPYGIGLIYFVSDPDSVKPMFTHPLGILLTLVALAFDFAGGFVIMKIVKIKV
ncbi:type II secretion system F family protein [Halobacteriovorax sp. JY17]|uniref:type II secretion system F family protein n=1 Tax=Halobacteriovorax sp. JY17 TaxID=2014617 RepID=UPI000C600185|nr:type II secretion system F family protein [Halobacteriovorax sp. JY17]PIK14528.1 MAG: secretion system protein F [Halobacteriovorax sp. JY17]